MAVIDLDLKTVLVENGDESFGRREQREASRETRVEPVGEEDKMELDSRLFEVRKEAW